MPRVNAPPAAGLLTALPRIADRQSASSSPVCSLPASHEPGRSVCVGVRARFKRAARRFRCMIYGNM